MKNFIKTISVLFLLFIFGLLAIGSGKPPKAPQETSASTTKENKFMEDGVIQDTNIFDIEKQLKSFSKYKWSEEHGVTEGRTGYFGTIYCEENDFWCDLYGNDLEEITSASLEVHKDDIDLLLTFCSYFETSLINYEEVETWINNYTADDGFVSKTFGDAEFHLNEYEDIIELTIQALE